MKKLPEIYKNKVTKSTNLKYNYAKTSPNQTIETKAIKTEPKEIVLKKIFQNKTSAYTKKVQIETKEKTLKTRLVYQTEQEVLTIDNEKIPLEKIISIQII